MLSTGEAADRVEELLHERDYIAVSETLTPLAPSEVRDVLERLSTKERAIVFRLLAKDRALAVFEGLDPAVQGDLVQGLRAEDVTGIFAAMDPDDRVSLLDELPAKVAERLLHGLSARERGLTAEVLGYPQNSIGRRMSPEILHARDDLTAMQLLELARRGARFAETIYTIPVTDRQRRLTGVVSMRDLMVADPDAIVSDIASEAISAEAAMDEEEAARRCADNDLLAMPIVDQEERLVGILTIDDAMRIIEEEESEDAARSGGAEPLRRPYLATPVFQIVRSRIVWLLVLAVSALLTVQVLHIFEATLEQMVVLSLFIPLLTGTGGNTGNQAATTVTRALALGDVTPRDMMRVLAREVRVGAMLGLLLGSLGLVLASLVFGLDIGIVIGSTLFLICTMAASVGGAMPLIGKWLKVDPAVFSNPFISTFCDATGLVIYFFIAKAVLGI